MPDPIATATGFAGFPTWVLLAPFATFGECRNHTTACSLTSANRAIEVSFELVDPPKVCRWFVNLTGRRKKLKRGFHGAPHILNSSGSFVVLLMAFSHCDGESVSDYFVYNAGGTGKPPSLDLIPGPCPTVHKHNLIAILPSDGGSGGGGEHYSVIFPVPQFKKRNDPNPRPMYKMMVFSSADRSWSTKFASMCYSPTTTYDEAYFRAVAVHPSKAIAVGRGLLAWIDLWRGVLLCDELDGDDPVLRVIEWPVPLPCRNAMDLYSAESSRDATLSVASDGTATIRFVRMKFRYSCSCQSRDAAVIPLGWTATIWKRRCSSSSKEGWEKCYKVDIAKILRGCSLKLLKCSSGPSDLQLLQKVWDTKSNKLDLSKMSSAPPLLSLTDEDVVYFTMNLLSNEALVIAVNARKKKLEAVAETSFELDFSPCSFSSRLLDASCSGTDNTVANQLDEGADDRDNVDCLVTNLQAALDGLKDIEENLELRKPWYNGIAPLCSDGSSPPSSLDDVIEAVAPCLSAKMRNDSTPDAVDLLVECFRELGDIKSRILAPLEEMKNKVSLALAALDTLQNCQNSIDGNGSDDAEHWVYVESFQNQNEDQQPAAPNNCS